MTTNPAESLAEKLESWRGQGVTPVEARGGIHPGNLTFWREQAAAVAEVRALDAAAEALTGESNFYAPAVVQWYQMAFSFWTNWESRGAVPGPPADGMAMLRGLGVTLRHTAAGQPALEDGQRADLESAIGDAVKLLKDADDLTEPERFYLLELLDATRRLIDERDLVDRVDLQRHIDQVMGAMTRMAATYQEAGDDEKGATFLDLAKRVYTASRHFTYDAAAVASIAAAAFGGIQAITG